MRQPPPCRTVAAARLPQRHPGGRRVTRHPHGASLLRCRLPRPPPLSRPQCGSRRQFCRAPAAIRARTVAAVPSERGLCAASKALFHPSAFRLHPCSAAPARTSAVSTDCRQTAPGQHQCKLPRQLSAEILARAFAPRRATSGLVRHPPASVASGGESRSLGKRITPHNICGSTATPARPSPTGRPPLKSEADTGRADLDFSAGIPAAGAAREKARPHRLCPGASARETAARQLCEAWQTCRSPHSVPLLRWKTWFPQTMKTSPTPTR